MTMELCVKAMYVGGALLAALPSTSEIDGALSAAGSLGGFGVLLYAVNYTVKLLKRKDEIIDERDKQIRELNSLLVSNCKNCELAKAANKALIED